MKLKTVILTIAAAVLSGCATVAMLPASVGAVNFDAPEGKTGWSEYREVREFAGVSVGDVYDAAKVGLGDAGFALREADKSRGVVVGEHGITLHDWNVIAGVYFKETPGGVFVAVLVEGSKDTGFSGDVTGDGWTGKILNAMEDHLQERGGN
ncbi:MAG: hypothetical protein ACR2QC_09020 [Gammaproteobacteria bacterium]